MPRICRAVYSARYSLGFERIHFYAAVTKSWSRIICFLVVKLNSLRYFVAFYAMLLRLDRWTGIYFSCWARPRIKLRRQLRLELIRTLRIISKYNETDMYLEMFPVVRQMIRVNLIRATLVLNVYMLRLLICYEAYVQLVLAYSFVIKLALDDTCKLDNIGF